MLGTLKRFGMILGFGLAATLPFSGAAAGEGAFSVEQCERRTGNNYDCECIAARADELREKESDRMLAYNLGRVERIERNITRTKKRLETETNPSRIAGLENSIRDDEREIADLQTRPDPASHTDNSLMILVAKEGTCRSYEKAYAATEEGCLSSPGSRNKDRAEEFCACVAEKAATEWAYSEDPRKSLRTVNARMACQS